MINQIMNKLQLTPMMRYFTYSIFVTILDTLVVWVLYQLFSVPIVISNTAGVILGFIIHYLLSSKSVFDTEFGTSGFVIYLTTFAVGLILADWLIYTGETLLFGTLSDNLSFLFSKGISIVIPFFFLYFLRKLLFEMLRRYQKNR